MPIIKLLVDGGEMKPGPTVGQKLGPLGINIGEVISKVNEASKEFKGMKVPAILDINPKTKEIKVQISSPPASELLKKEANIEKAANDKKTQTVANISIEDIIKVAKVKHGNMLSKEFKSTVKSIIGTCASMGIHLESKTAYEVQEEVNQGKYDTEINEEKTETSPEKRKDLKQWLDKAIKEQEEAAKLAEEAKKAAEEATKAVTEEKPAEGAEETKAEGTEEKSAKEPIKKQAKEGK